MNFEDISKFDESFIKSYDGKSDKGHFLEIDVQYPETFIMIYHFYLKE